MKFYTRLRELRNSKDMSQQKLADFLGISKSSINMYERGEREPGLELLENIADFFNCSVDYLLGRTDNPDSHKSKTKNYTLPPLELAAYGAEGTKGTYTTPTEEIT